MRLALFAILAGGLLVVGSGCQMLGGNNCDNCNSCDSGCGQNCNSWGFHNPCPNNCCDPCASGGCGQSGLLGRLFGRGGGGGMGGGGMGGGGMGGGGMAGGAGIGDGSGMGYYPQANYAGPPTGAVTYPYYTNRGPRDFLARRPLDIGP